MTFGYSQTEPPLGVPKSRRAKTCLLSGLADPLGTKPFQRWTALPLQIDPLNQLIGGKVLIGLLIRK